MPPSLGRILRYSAIPVATAICGGLVAAWKPPTARLAAAVQHFAAGVVFAAAASELLPDVLHQRALLPTLFGGAAGVALMVSVKTWASRAKAARSLIAITAADILVDGLVVGVGFLAGMRQGMLLTFALSIELLFLGLSVAAALAQTAATRSQIVTTTGGLALPSARCDHRWGAATGQGSDLHTDSFLCLWTCRAALSLDRGIARRST